jgi:hypothetical protein
MDRHVGILALVLLTSAPLLTGAGDEKKDADTASSDKKGPPFGEAPKKEEPKPAERTWVVKAGELEFSVVMKPGIPDPDQVTEVMIQANAIPKTPHPRYGNRVPLEDANLVVEATNPAGELVGRFLAHAMPLANGKYGLHITPRQEGLYSLAIRGTSADGKALSADLKLPVKVWPLPPELRGSGDASSSRKPIKM